MATTIKPEDEKKLSEFIARGPLYIPVKFTLQCDTRTATLAMAVPGGRPTTDFRLTPLAAIIPDRLENDCPPCEKVTWHSRKTSNSTQGGGLEVVSYLCKNCEKAILTVWVRWSIQKEFVTFEKYGQHPKLEIRPAKSLKKVLGTKAALYQKGLISRHQGYGLGAVAYLRRVVEDTIDEMIDALLQAMRETTSDEGAIAKIEEAKTSRAVKDKIKAVADLVPNHLRPGGVNPFGLLYGLLSTGLHDQTEEECLDIADGIIKVFDHVFVEMSAHVEHRKSFTTGIQALQGKYAATKKRPEP